MHIQIIAKFDRTLKDFCHQIFPELNKNIHIKNWLEGRVILAPINEEVDA